MVTSSFDLLAPREFYFECFMQARMWLQPGAGLWSQDLWHLVAPQHGRRCGKAVLVVGVKKRPKGRTLLLVSH